MAFVIIIIIIVVVDWSCLAVVKHVNKLVELLKYFSFVVHLLKELIILHLRTTWLLDQDSALR
jgi:hypothetical protein